MYVHPQHVTVSCDRSSNTRLQKIAWYPARKNDIRQLDVAMLFTAMLICTINIKKRCWQAPVSPESSVARGGSCVCVCVCSVPLCVMVPTDIATAGSLSQVVAIGTWQHMIATVVGHFALGLLRKSGSFCQLFSPRSQLVNLPPEWEWQTQGSDYSPPPRCGRFRSKLTPRPTWSTPPTWNKVNNQT